MLDIHSRIACDAMNHVVLSPSDLIDTDPIISLLFQFKLQETMLIFVFGRSTTTCFVTNVGALEIEDEVKHVTYLASGFLNLNNKFIFLLFIKNITKNRQ